jgi:hypothetical protein
MQALRAYEKAFTDPLKGWAHLQKKDEVQPGTAPK